MTKLTIDGIEVEVPAGSSLIQACEAAGREIPRFCYHEKLSIAGNCRMCLVEVEKSPKPVASCAYPVAEGMVVHTDTPMVRNGRRGIMEFLLINHPLDCPVCDQGGQCDLQDLSMGYGGDSSRFRENKRAVKDKYFGPIVKTVMTRCIQCTRCVRFASEIAGVPELGATARGENIEIGTYVEHALSSELSGNLVDICPVGALLSKPYSYAMRAWDLKSTPSIDVLDAVGSNIRVDARGAEVMRILPLGNDDINEGWLADKSRHSNDGLKRRRLDSPWVRRGGRLVRATWDDAFDAVATRLRGLSGDRIGAVVGNLCDAESMVALRDLMERLGSRNVDCRQDGADYSTAHRAHYVFGTGIANLEQADAILLVGTNPRVEAPLINARIRKRYVAGGAGGLKVAAIGPHAELTYPVSWLGEGPAALSDLGAFADVLRAAKRPVIIVGQSALTQPGVLAACWKLAQDHGMLTPEWHGFNVLQAAAGRVGALDLGLVPGEGAKGFDAMMGGGVDFLWLLGADEFDTTRIGADTFVVYQGHHGDAGAARADVILPGAAYTEKNGTYVSTEGRVQRGELAVFPPGECREDWRIIRAFSGVIGLTLPYDDLDAVRARLAEVNPVFKETGARPSFTGDIPAPASNGAIGGGAFEPWFATYYQTDPISRASATMAACIVEIGPRLGAPLTSQPLQIAAE